MQSKEEWLKAYREWELNTPDVDPEPIGIEEIKNGMRFRDGGNVYLARSHALVLGGKVFLSVRCNDWVKREKSWPKGTIVERVGKETMPPFPEWYFKGKDWPE